MEEAAVLKEIAGPVKGIQPSFTPYHVFKVLWALSEEKALGRPTLTKIVGLREASMKTLLRRLQAGGYVTSRKPEGTTLTAKGKGLVRRLLEHFHVVEHLTATDICGECTAAAVLSDGDVTARLKGFGVVRLRDEVVRHGALGAIFVVKMGGDLLLPTPEGYTPFTGFAMDAELRSMDVLREGESALIALCNINDGGACASYSFNAIINLLGGKDC